VQVALPLPLFQTFTYAVEDGLANPVRIGSRVIVPLRNDKEVGICVGLSDASPLKRKPKAVVDSPDVEPAIGASLLELCKWMADYYVVPLGVVLRAVLPAALTGADAPQPSRKTRRLIRVGAEIPSLLERDKTFARSKQQRAVFELVESLGGRTTAEHLSSQLDFSPSVLKSLEKRGLIVVDEEEVEREFWRLVENLTETVEVEYGADIHSTTHGSGFPTIEKNPLNPYSKHPWNLNVLPFHEESLFRHIKTDISGMTVPWLYVGMCFSTFCWHNEDHYCYSINYQHFGATKTWYGIPGSDAEKFEATMRNAVPDLFETQPDLLFQLVTMLSPGRLVEEGVKVYAVDQRPNQFVITFPQAYHAGFNHGVLSL